MYFEKMNGQKSILNSLFSIRMANAIEQALKNDKKYQEVNEKVGIKTEAIEKAKFNPEQCRLVDDALSASNEMSLEYERVAYYQGFIDAISLLEEIHSLSAPPMEKGCK